MVPRKLVREGGPPSTFSQGPTSVMEEGEGVDGARSQWEHGTFGGRQEHVLWERATGKRTAPQETPRMPMPWSGGSPGWWLNAQWAGSWSAARGLRA